MKRDIASLDETFDLLVIGGGIYGAWTAYDAALRGLRVALVEKSDWAAGTSSASTKLIHGGLRYLEHRDFTLVRASLDERRRLSELGPHRVRPLRFVLPVYKGARVGPIRLGIGLWLYDLLSGRNQPVPRHSSLSRARVVEELPFLRRDGLRQAFTYGDCQTDDARFTLEIVDGACRAGVVAVNHAEVQEILTTRERASGAVVRDQLGADTIEVQASVIVNTAGPWAPNLGLEPRTNLRLVKGAHLVMPALQTSDAVLLMTPDKQRVFFMIPWYGRTLVGTTDTDFSGNPDNVSVTETDVEYLLNSANEFLEVPCWSDQDICGRFAGIRALQDENGRAPSDVTREWQLVHSSNGVLTSTGGKFTSARRDASFIVDRVFAVLGKHSSERPTESKPFPWAPQNFEAWLAESIRQGVSLGMDEEVATNLSLRYGKEVTTVHKIVEGDRSLADRIVSSLAFCKAEWVRGARDEMTMTLLDLATRRIPLSVLTPMSKRILEEAADLAGNILGWDEERRRAEVGTVLRPRS